MVTDRNTGGPVDVVLVWLASRLGRFITAVVSGMVAATGIVAYSPQVVIDTDAMREAVLSDRNAVQEIARPDPCYGFQCRENARMIEQQKMELSRLSQRVAELERHGVLFRDHVKKSEKGWDFIYECRSSVRALQEENTRIWQNIRHLQGWNENR